jgi:chitodextrinase
MRRYSPCSVFRGGCLKGLRANKAGSKTFSFLSSIVFKKQTAGRHMLKRLGLRDLNAFVALFGIFLFVSQVQGSTSQAPGTGVPIPIGNWTLMTTAGIPESSNDWEQLIYAHSLQQSIMLSIYHQSNSEPNETLVGYNFDTNAWDVLDMGGPFHTENMPEGGESIGYLDYNPNNNTLVYHCCTSGSNQPENVNHTWWFDLQGQAGRDKQTPAEPPFLALQPGGAFDDAHNVFVMFGGASYIGTWIYDPVGDTWQNLTTGGTPPDPSVILPAMAYDSQAQQVFLFGGRDSSTYYSSLYSYNVSTNTWTAISPVGGVPPPPRYRTNFAYDSTNNVFLLYGGTNASGVLNDTWVYDPAANTWTQLNPAQSPPVQGVSDFARLAYDSDHNAFVLAHKGSGAYFGGNWKTLPIQTWLFRYAGTGPNAGTLLNTTRPPAGGLNRNLGSWAKDPAIASSGTSLYASWAETGSPFDPSPGNFVHIYSEQYSGGSWLPAGSSYGSISGASVEAHAPSMAVVSGTPWISWYQADSPSENITQVYAANWNGSSWSSGPVGLVNSEDNQGRSQLANVNGVPYLGFLEVDKAYYPQSDFAYVKSWNGASWSLVGTGPLNMSSGAGSTATSISVASDGTYPYAAWTEYVRTFTSQGDAATPPQVYVSHWNGSQWSTVGGSLNVVSTDWATDASVAYFNGQPYVAWTERSQTGNAQLYVATWNGAAWTTVGPGPLNQGGLDGWAFHPCIITDHTGSNLYVAWVEQTALGNKAQVFVAQLIGASWTLLGGPLNVDPVQGSAQRVSLAVLNGQPVAEWGEVDFTGLRQIYVSQWNGTNWMQLPGPALTDTTPPTLPTGLIGTANSSTQISLSWSGSTDIVGVAGYYIYRNGVQVATVTSSLSYTDTGLNPSTNYTYNVAAYDAAGNVSAKSVSTNVTTLGGGSVAVSITAPANGSIVSGTVTLSANATSGLGMSYVQFQIDGTNLGNPIVGSGPFYSTSWNTTSASNASHTITAIATDNGGNSANANVTVTVDNPVGPVISDVSAGSITSSGATITWTTSTPATSQVAYGLTPSYGSLSSLNPALVTSHSVILSGLSASTTYHYQAISQDGAGNTTNSADYTFTTSAPGLNTVLQIEANTSEVSGTTNGSTVTPTVAPSGFTGTVVVNGAGSVNFTPSQSGNGVYFLNCCKNTNDAYFSFAGTTIGSIFNVNEGQISFTLQSNYSFAQRKATAAAPRYTFDVRDGNGTHLFYFLTQVITGLQFNYVVDGQAEVYYVPSGTENALYGDGVILQVSMTWNAGTMNLYLNGTLVKSSSYTAPTPNWNSSSVLEFGAYDYMTFGGYNVSDDVVSNFVISAP